MIDSLIQAFTDSKDTIVDGAFQVINMLIVATGDLLPDLVALGADLLTSIIDGIVANLPTLVETALTLIEKLASGVTQYLPELSATLIDLIEYIVSVLTDDKNLDVILDSALAIILALAGFIVDVAPELVDATVQIISKLAEYLLDPENVTKIATAALQIVVELGKALTNSAGSILEGVGNLVIAIVESLFETDWLEVGQEIGTSILQGIVDIFDLKGDVDKIENPSGVNWSQYQKYKPQNPLDDFINNLPKTDTESNIDIESLPPLEYDPFNNSNNRFTPPVIVQNIYSQAQTAADLAQETQWEAQRTWLSQTEG